MPPEEPTVSHQREIPDQRLVNRLADVLERTRIAEYVQLMQDPLRLIYLSFISGLARGLGLAIGFTVLGAIVIYVLQRLVLNVPALARIIAQLIEAVRSNMIR